MLSKVKKTKEDLSMVKEKEVEVVKENTNSSIFMNIVRREQLYNVIDDIKKDLNYKNDENFLILTVDPEGEEKDHLVKYSNKFFVFYEVDKNNKKKRNGTLIHKKLRTYYTINALNALIVSINGKEDKNYVVDWEQYKNCLLFLDRENKLNIIKTKFYKKI